MNPSGNRSANCPAGRGDAGATAADAADATAIEALWAQQERLRRVVAAGEPAPAADRALYAALAQMRPPPPPDDLVVASVALVRRSVEARRRIQRLRAVLLRVFALLYVPVMLLVALAFAADLPALWLRADPGERPPLQWGAVVMLLAAGSMLAARRRARDPGG